MFRRWRLAGLLLGAACASGTPASRPATPAPSSPSVPRPNVDPARTDPAAASAVRYPTRGGGIARYAFTRRDSVLATMPSGESQLQVLGRTAYLTLTWVASDSGTRLTAVVDSIRADSGLAALVPLLDSARAARWTARRDLAGRLTVETASSPSLAAAQVQDELLLLSLPLPPEGANAGASWTDSTSGPARVSAFAITEMARIEAHADPAPAAGGALPVTLYRVRTASGEASQFGQPISVTATGADTLVYHLAADGRVLQVAGQRWTDMVVSLPSIGQTVPARESSRLLLTLLR